MSVSETERLESLWRGNFGDAYHKRITPDVCIERRLKFWQWISSQMASIPHQVLEVGCGTCANLHTLRLVNSDAQCIGVDINHRALVAAKTPCVAMGIARQLPFKDASVDLVFTVGLLIHVAPDSLRQVCHEIGRVAARWVCLSEYYSPNPIEVKSYHSEDGVLFKRDFGTFFEQASNGHIWQCIGQKDLVDMVSATVLRCWLFHRVGA